MRKTTVQPSPVLPAIRARVTRTLLWGSVFWTVAVTLAVSLAVRHEASEFLDKNLGLSAQIMASTLEQDSAKDQATQLQGMVKVPAFAQAEAEFAWQLVAYPARGAPQVQMASSALASSQALFATSVVGFHDLRVWRIYGVALNVNTPLGDSPRVLYVAQLLNEREETQYEATLSAVLASVVMAFIAFLLLNIQLQKELKPLQNLAQRLTKKDALTDGEAIGIAERQELLPIYQALDTLAANLAQRLANERAFSAHAAHALRTPLAGIDAQLAVALRESPPHLMQRLQTIRSASARLQRVVSTLLTLFRSGSQIHPQTLDLKTWISQLPWQGVGQLELRFDAHGHSHIHADSDLLAVAVLNLLDNAYRYGAQNLTVSSPKLGVLRLEDDGPGIPREQRDQILLSLEDFSLNKSFNTLQATEHEKSAGLGLLLADMVARAHGGQLLIPVTAQGCVVELVLA